MKRDYSDDAENEEDGNPDGEDHDDLADLYPGKFSPE